MEMAPLFNYIVVEGNKWILFFSQKHITLFQWGSFFRIHLLDAHTHTHTHTLDAMVEWNELWHWWKRNQIMNTAFSDRKTIFVGGENAQQTCSNGRKRKHPFWGKSKTRETAEIFLPGQLEHSLNVQSERGQHSTGLVRRMEFLFEISEDDCLRVSMFAIESVDPSLSLSLSLSLFSFVSHTILCCSIPWIGTADSNRTVVVLLTTTIVLTSYPPFRFVSSPLSLSPSSFRMAISRNNLCACAKSTMCLVWGFVELSLCNRVPPVQQSLAFFSLFFFLSQRFLANVYVQPPPT